MDETSDKLGLEDEAAIRASFECDLPAMIARKHRTRVHSIIPHDFFAAASSECAKMFVSGHFIGCITLCQSVAEGLSKFLADVNHLRIKKDFSDRVLRLARAHIVSDAARDALLSIHGNDRNDFHHMNKQGMLNIKDIERRALNCIDSLFLVEAEVFAFGVDDGVIIRKQPKYWSTVGPGDLNVFVREH